MKNIFYYETKIGKLGIADENSAITSVIFKEKSLDGYSIAETGLIKEAKRQLDEYFEGKRKCFELPLNPHGTQFQKKVWKVLLEIPYGKTMSYKDIAEKCACPLGYRAVGMANNKNPIPVIIPCHRVIGKSGKLVGYAGGLAIKSMLLKIEQSAKD